jgi:uncharacterized membrane protein YraQ (UPF0718 family)
MKLAYILLLTGVVLMAAAFAVPKLFGGRAALRGELEQELATSGELHMATAHSHDGSEAPPAHSAEDDLQQRIDAALNQGQTTAAVLKWLGIGVAIAGVVLLGINNAKAEGR